MARPESFLTPSATTTESWPPDGCVKMMLPFPLASDEQAAVGEQQVHRTLDGPAVRVSGELPNQLPAGVVALDLIGHLVGDVQEAAVVGKPANRILLPTIE